MGVAGRHHRPAPAHRASRCAVHAAVVRLDSGRQELRLAGAGDGLACVFLACGAAAVRGHHAGAPARTGRALQSDPPVGQHRLHPGGGRSGPGVRAAGAGCLSGGSAADHGRHCHQQPLGTQCRARAASGSGRAGRLPAPAVASRRAGVLPLRRADAAVARAVLHLPQHPPGGARLHTHHHWPALGAGCSSGNPAVSGDGAAARALQPAPGIGGELSTGGVALAAAGQPGRSSAGVADRPSDARRHLRQLPCRGDPFRPAQFRPSPAGPGTGAVRDPGRCWRRAWRAVFRLRLEQPRSGVDLHHRQPGGAGAAVIIAARMRDQSPT